MALAYKCQIGCAHRVFVMVSKVAVFLSLLSFVYLGNVVTARKVFIISSYFNTLRVNMVYLWPVSLTYFAEACTTIKRVEEFLLRPESKFSLKLNGKDEKYAKNIINSSDNMIFDKNHSKISNSDTKEDTIMQTWSRRIQNIDSSEKAIRFENATAVWEQREGQMNGLFDLSLEIKPGLCAVVGSVGSGKSTLLNVILGELSLDAGSLTVNGSISYASQEPWIFEGTVRDNIVFVEDFDQQRYNTVVEVCALKRDFELLPQGDATIVGEQGSSLSGGQKARVNLARAIYKRSDIYLLDDPLSAVDTHVGKHIFEKCIKGYLADKICVLVTHQLQYLKNVQHVVLMSGGRIEAQGPFRTLQKFNKESLTLAQEEGEQNVLENTQSRIRKISSSISFCDENVEINSNDRKEHLASGSVKLRTFITYFKAAKSSIIVFSVVILLILSQLAYSGSDYFLSAWVNWEEEVAISNSAQASSMKSINNNSSSTENQSSENSESVTRNRELVLIVYSIFMVFATFCYVSRAFLFFKMGIRISINLHDMIFRGITRAKMIFFNINPSGRILNRFARDINIVDSMLPSCIIYVIDCFLQYSGIIIINAVVNPWLLIPAFVMTICFYILRSIYANTGRSFKRNEALSRSPMFSHMNVTLQGLSTVRASGANAMVEKEFHEYQDHNTSCWYLFICASRWLAVWLDVLCLLFITFVTYSFLLFEDKMQMQSGQVGLVILGSFSLVRTCQLGIRESAELENQMISVERINEYAELPSEPPLESDPKNAPPKDWPQHGNIEFKSLSLRYAEKGPRTLRNLTFRINAQEKVGVVGRTGAGKSSIIQSLFRLAQNEGQILIDDIDIGSIGLHDLRKKISIIPQEAVLFSGNLRFNLDPFAERSDDELWSSLEQIELKSVVSALPGGLNTKVLDGGSNFSAGQRQLFCLARAILRNNKILILDEATANVDSETDKLIQKTIRNKFADCTVITIAHRLHTIMDSDKVLVVDAGRIMEFDHPFNLIQKPDGHFKQLLDQSGATNAAELTIIAKESYDKQHTAH